MFGKIMGKISSFVKDRSVSQVAIKEQKPHYPNFNITAKIVKDYEAQNKIEGNSAILKYKFPLEKDDVIEFRNGKKYKVCKRTITGAIMNTSVTLAWINKPEMLRELDKMERAKYSSLRELNFYIEKEINSIVQINKSYKNREERVYSLDDCYELAKEENQKREQIKSFFNKCAQNSKL